MAQSDSQIEGRGSDYPVQFSVDYQESSNRLSVLPRILLAIPILVVFAVIGGAIDTGDSELNEALMPLYAGGFLFIGPLLMILFRKKYPRWWFDWNLELSRFTSRVDGVCAAAPGRVSLHRRRAVGASADRVSERRD